MESAKWTVECPKNSKVDFWERQRATTNDKDPETAATTISSIGEIFRPVDIDGQLCFDYFHETMNLLRHMSFCYCVCLC